MIQKVKEFPKPGKPIEKSNGKKIIPNVEIFRKTYREDVDKYFDDNWMISNVERMNQLQKENYLHTVHKNHHPKDVPNPDDYVENFGFMRDVRILEKEDTGEKRIYCDYDDFTDDRVKLLEDNQFPHRSVEIVNDEIKSLALLKSIPPYFKAPIVSPKYTEFQDKGLESVYFAEIDKEKKQIVFSNFFKEGDEMPEDLQDEEIAEVENVNDGSDDFIPTEPTNSDDQDVGDVTYEEMKDDIKAIINEALEQFALKLKADMNTAQPAAQPAAQPPMSPSPVAMSEIQFQEQLAKASYGKEGKAIGNKYVSRDTSGLRRQLLTFAQKGEVAKIIDYACDAIPYTSDSDVPQEMQVKFQEQLLESELPKELKGKEKAEEIILEFSEPDNERAKFFKTLYGDTELARISYYKERKKEVV